MSDAIKDYHKINSSLELDKFVKFMMPMFDIGRAYPLYLKFYTEKEMNSITRKMQSFYFGVILKQIKEWNIETGVFCYEETDEPILDIDILDSFFREKFYSVKVSTAKGVSIIPKTLKLSKANRKDVLEYFDTIIRIMAKLGLFIETMELENLRNMINES